MEIKVLARRGTAVREIARQTGLSRNTVRRYLRDEQAGRYKQREARPTKLDPFKDYLLERGAGAGALEAAPCAAAREPATSAGGI